MSLPVSLWEQPIPELEFSQARKGFALCLTSQIEPKQNLRVFHNGPLTKKSQFEWSPTMAQASVLSPSHLQSKLERTVKNVRRMRRLLNRLREQMYEALDKPIPVRSFVRDHKEKAGPQYEPESIEERLMRAREILQTIYPDTRLAFDQTAWGVAERYRDIWNLLDGACYLVEKELALNGPASRTGSSPSLVASSNKESPSPED